MERGPGLEYFIILDTLSKNAPTASKKREKTQNEKKTNSFELKRKENAEADG